MEDNINFDNDFPDFEQFISSYEQNNSFNGNAASSKETSTSFDSSNTRT